MYQLATALPSVRKPLASKAAILGASKKFFSSDSVTLTLNDNVFKTHLIGTPKPEATITKEECWDYFQTMYRMRRMEITCDTEYKARNIRGFCHLYDGQEAIAVGVGNVLNADDAWITSYRCHCVSLMRGGTVEGVLAELFGFKEGQTGGKGGSMHLYNKKGGFFGGQGIVGAQVPVGAGLAFAAKYKTPPGEKMPVAFAAFGDGAANQGQVWEAANMSSLWKLPMMFCIENNQYGMGTSIERSSSNNDYYTMGNTIPGIKMDGMNVFAVREGMKVAKEWCATGNGPLYIEMNTYRYHGHSMSDPGTTYRNRDEVQAMRSARDPIEYVKNVMVEHGFATPEELKATEKEIRGEVQDTLKRVKAGSGPYLNLAAGGKCQHTSI